MILLKHRPRGPFRRFVVCLGYRDPIYRAPNAINSSTILEATLFFAGRRCRLAGKSRPVGLQTEDAKGAAPMGKKNY
jgi:hypothetical protein